MDTDAPGPGSGRVVCLDSLDEHLAWIKEQELAEKAEKASWSKDTSSSRDSVDAWALALQDKINVIMHKLDLQTEMIQRLVVEDAPDPLAGFNEFSFSRHVSPSDGDPDEDQQVVQRGTDKTLMSQMLKSYTEDDRQRRDTAHKVNSVTHRRRFSHRGRASPGEEVRPRCSGCISNIVSHPSFEVFWAVVVLSNAVLLGVEVQTSLSLDNLARPMELFVVQIVYTALFSIELLLRIWGRGLQIFYSEGCGWIWMDLLIVVTAVLEVAIEVAGESSGSLSTVTSFKSFRLVRLTRLLRTVQFIRIFRFIMALRTLVTSIFSTLKALSWALILLFLIIYVFAVLFTQTVNDYLRDPTNPPLSDEVMQACDRHYGSITNTMLSLFMSIAGGVSWTEVFEPLKQISTVWAASYLFYLCFTYFAVLNVVTAVFCQSAIESAQSDHLNMVQSMLHDKEMHLHKIKALFSELGAADTGLITFAMFEEKIDSAEVRAYFESLGLDVDDAWSFFKLLDSDGGGTVEIEEFFLGCLRFRGQARSMDVGKLLQDQKWLIRSHSRFQGYVEAELACMREMIDRLCHMSIASTRAHSRPPAAASAASMARLQEEKSLDEFPSLFPTGP